MTHPLPRPGPRRALDLLLPLGVACVGPAIEDPTTPSPDPDGVDGVADTAAPDAPCDDETTDAVTWEDPVLDDRSAEDLFAWAGGVRTGKVTWWDDEGTEVELSVLARPEDPPRLTTSGACHNDLTLPIVATVTTTDGRLDEVWSGDLVIQSGTESAFLRWEWRLDGLVGTLDGASLLGTDDYIDIDARPAFVGLRATLLPDGHEGDLTVGAALGDPDDLSWLDQPREQWPDYVFEDAGTW